MAIVHGVATCRRFFAVEDKIGIDRDKYYFYNIHQRRRESMQALQALQELLEEVVEEAVMKFINGLMAELGGKLK